MSQDPLSNLLASRNIETITEILPKDEGSDANGYTVTDNQESFYTKVMFKPAEKEPVEMNSRSGGNENRTIHSGELLVPQSALRKFFSTIGNTICGLCRNIRNDFYMLIKEDPLLDELEKSERLIDEEKLKKEIQKPKQFFERLNASVASFHKTEITDKARRIKKAAYQMILKELAERGKLLNKYLIEKDIPVSNEDKKRLEEQIKELDKPNDLKRTNNTVKMLNILTDIFDQKGLTWPIPFHNLKQKGVINQLLHICQNAASLDDILPKVEHLLPNEPK